MFSSSSRIAPGLQSDDGEAHEQQLVLEGHEVEVGGARAHQRVQQAPVHRRLQPLVLEQHQRRVGEGVGGGQQQPAPLAARQPVAGPGQVAGAGVLQDPDDAVAGAELLHEHVQHHARHLGDLRGGRQHLGHPLQHAHLVVPPGQARLELGHVLGQGGDLPLAVEQVHQQFGALLLVHAAGHVPAGPGAGRGRGGLGGRDRRVAHSYPGWPEDLGLQELL